MKRTDTDVEIFLADLPGKQGDDIRLLDASIVERMPGHQRHLYEGRFWGGSEQQIIGYGVLDHTDSSGEEVEWFIVGLAAQKSYISMYVNAVADGTYLLRQYDDKLGKAKIGSASVSFESVDDLDAEMLLEMVSRAGDS